MGNIQDLLDDIRLKVAEMAESMEELHRLIGSIRDNEEALTTMLTTTGQLWILDTDTPVCCQCFDVGDIDDREWQSVRLGKSRYVSWTCPECRGENVES